VKISAGLLMYRVRGPIPEFLLAHPGGPFFARRDRGHWTVPKGLVEPGESPLDAAIREFDEETGFATHPPYLPLGHVDQSKKRVFVWAVEGDADPAALQSNPFEVEWPPRSGRLQTYPEIDRVAWFDPVSATAHILKAQQPLLLRAMAHLASR
jgi:predicted NUDIX family NTP pyrophosphohydrolase